MSTERLQIELDSRLTAHIKKQVGENPAFGNASDYIQDLIRRDLQSRSADLEWLRQTLEPALRADETEFVSVTAEDVILRNKHR